jgi:hypothetical protein
MRFPFRLTLGARTLALIAFALLSVGLGGACENNHVGRTCDLGVESDGTETTITSPALECPSRICILPQAEKPAAGTLPLCTATCSSDGDCDGEAADKSDSNDHRCRTGFTCKWPTTVGPFCCQKMCICRDFLLMTPKGGWPEPAACKDSSGGCVNDR